MLFGPSLRPVAVAEPVLRRITPGMSLSEVQRVLASSTFDDVRWWKRADSKALAEGLVRTRLLELLNAMRLTPLDRESGALDPEAFREIAVLKRKDAFYVLAFGARPELESAPGPRGNEGKESVLRYALARVPVPVDRSRDAGGSFSPGRLHRLRDALADLERAGHAMKPVSRDRHGNVSSWRADGKTPVAALYSPELDELAVVSFLASD